MDKETQVSKEDLVRDFSGNVISANRKEVNEEDGRVGERTEKVVTMCEGCGSYITSPEEAGPRCSVCGLRTCKNCMVKCQVCGTPLCPEHRLGFAGKGVTVCRQCKRELKNRQLFNDLNKIQEKRFNQLLKVEKERRKRLKDSGRHPSARPAVPGRKTIERLKSKLGR